MITGTMWAWETDGRKDALFDGLAEVAKALASGRRAEIVDVLSEWERSVEAIAEELGQWANTSHHLWALAHAGLVRTAGTGPILYDLGSERDRRIVGRPT